MPSIMKAWTSVQVELTLLPQPQGWLQDKEMMLGHEYIKNLKAEYSNLENSCVLCHSKDAYQSKGKADS